MLLTEAALHLRDNLFLYKLVRNRLDHVGWRVNLPRVSSTEVVLKVFYNFIVFYLLAVLIAVISDFKSTLFSKIGINVDHFSRLREALSYLLKLKS